MTIARDHAATARCALTHASIDCLTFDQAVTSICDLAVQKGQGHIVVTPNIQHIALLESDLDFRLAYRSASLVLADGWPVVLLARLCGARQAERVTGSDLLPALCAAAAEQGLSVGFMGGPPLAARQAGRRLQTALPELQVAIVEEAPRGFDNSAESLCVVLDRVAAAKPHILFLALGSPRQELFALQYRDRLGAGVVVCVGAAMTFAAGLRRRAPRCLQQRGLEWLYRAALEPLRLGPRYLWAAPRFAAIAGHELFRRRFRI